MDGGGICEDGTPDQIFNHPKEERTRIFIKRLKQLSMKVENSNYDFIASVSKIEQFGKDNMLKPKMLRDVQLVFEEIVTQNLVPYGETYNNLYPIDILLEYSDLDESLKMDIKYCGDEYDPFKDGNELSATIVKKLTLDPQYRFGDGQNEINITFLHY